MPRNESKIPTPKRRWLVEDLIVMKHSTSQNQSAGHNISQVNGYTINYFSFMLKCDCYITHIHTTLATTTMSRLIFAHSPKVEQITNDDYEGHSKSDFCQYSIKFKFENRIKCKIRLEFNMISTRGPRGKYLSTA